MTTYRCLSCGCVVTRGYAEPLPRDTERCSHEFEVVDWNECGPEMYDALRLIVDCFECEGGRVSDACIEAARTAIAKARTVTRHP